MRRRDHLRRHPRSAVVDPGSRTADTANPLAVAGAVGRPEAWQPADADAFPDARIIGERHGRGVPLFAARLTDRATAINARKAASGAPLTSIRLKTTLGPTAPPFVHDRFAVVDDELWHFGATVGGLHHGLNAATRGWSATAVGAVQFFSEVWNQRTRGGEVRTACRPGTR